jgi:hypothetical protein
MAERTNYHVALSGSMWVTQIEGDSNILFKEFVSENIVTKTVDHAQQHKPSTVKIYGANGAIEVEKVYE